MIIQIDVELSPIDANGYSVDEFFVVEKNKSIYISIFLISPIFFVQRANYQKYSLQ